MEEQPKKEPSVSVRWIDDNSVVVRFQDEDAALALSNFITHNTSTTTITNDDDTTDVNEVEKTAPMTLITLDSYMRSVDEEMEEDCDKDDDGNHGTAGNGDEGGNKKRGGVGSSLVTPSNMKKAKINNQ